MTKGRVVVGTAIGRAAVLSGAMLLGFVLDALLTVRYIGIASVGQYATVPSLLC